MSEGRRGTAPRLRVHVEDALGQAQPVVDVVAGRRSSLARICFTSPPPRPLSFARVSHVSSFSVSALQPWNVTFTG